MEFGRREWFGGKKLCLRYIEGVGIWFLEGLPGERWMRWNIGPHEPCSLVPFKYPFRGRLGGSTG